MKFSVTVLHFDREGNTSVVCKGTFEDDLENLPNLPYKFYSDSMPLEFIITTDGGKRAGRRKSRNISN